ncbi:MAG: hypothetical protein ABIS86_19900 [Streptosporangiaceae bacterium]
MKTQRSAWRRPVRVTAAVFGAGLLSLTLSGAAGAQSKALPPPPQVKGLDFLLGSFECAYTPPPGGSPSVTYTKTRRALGGHYYDTEVRIEPGSLRGFASYGWNPVEGTFISQYHDDWGSSANYVSPGWKDGHLVFTGRLLQVITPSATGKAPGVWMDIQEDYHLLGRGHFTSVQTFTLPSGVTLQGTSDCRRA